MANRLSYLAESMQILNSDTHPDLVTMLNGYDYPAILVTAEYQILATNDLYQEHFGNIDNTKPARCYKVSHGYNVPCDQAGEACPLAAAVHSGQKERVLHIHQTPRGREHVDVEMLPIKDGNGKLKFFVELLKPVQVASAQAAKARMVGISAAFNRMLENITRVGPLNASVLLLGESGTGKELAAKAIHEASTRKSRALVTLECSGLTEALFESELYGHVKGAFTSASHSKKGLVEEANGGTLFLDEIGDVPLELQVKLLRLIETGMYRPVGSTVNKHSDFRLVCATHRNLLRMVERGEFRQDLYYRINVFPIHMPSLAERKEDIPLIAESLLSRLSPDNSHILTQSALIALSSHTYRGNIRELRNILARAVVLSNTHVIDSHVIHSSLELEQGLQSQLEASAETRTEKVDLKPEAQRMGADPKSYEREYLEKLLSEYGGDKKRAAAEAGISLRTLYRKLNG